MPASHDQVEYASVQSGDGLPPWNNEPAYWQWRELPAMGEERYGAGGCVMSDGRFAVLGGMDDEGNNLASCQAGGSSTFRLGVSTFCVVC